MSYVGRDSVSVDKIGHVNLTLTLQHNLIL